MGNWLEDTLGTDLTAYDEFSGPGKGKYHVLPEGTRVLARVQAVTGKTNKNGRPYPEMVLKTVAIPSADLALTVTEESGATVPARYGLPTLYDRRKLTIPEAPAKFIGQPDDVVTKRRQAAGIWLRYVKALGLDPANAGGDLSQDAVQAFFVGALGNLVIVKLGVEPASADGKYPPRNSVESYEEVSDRNLTRNHLALPDAEATPF